MGAGSDYLGEIAARVGENLDAWRLDAFDVKTWMRERLIDILVLGSGTIDIEDFKKLAKGTGVLIYPCVYGWPSGYRHVEFDGRGGQGGLPPELARGLAARYWQQGGDGMYTKTGSQIKSIFVTRWTYLQ